jgi:hypothetical protein
MGPEQFLDALLGQVEDACTVRPLTANPARGYWFWEIDNCWLIEGSAQ